MKKSDFGLIEIVDRYLNKSFMEFLSDLLFLIHFGFLLETILFKFCCKYGYWQQTIPNL